MNDFRALVIEEESGGILRVLLVPEDKMSESDMDAVHELAAFFCQRVRNIVPDVCTDLGEVQTKLKDMNRTNPCSCELPGMFNSGVPGILAQVQEGKIFSSVERCDLCQRYPSDEAAEEALRQILNSRKERG